MQVMERLLVQHNYDQVVYLGGGAGDFCPCTRLGPQDIVIARQCYPSGAECPLLRMATQKGWPVAQSSGASSLCESSGEVAASWQKEGVETGCAIQQLTPWTEMNYCTSTPGIVKLNAVCCAWSQPAEAAALLQELSGMA